MPELPAMIVESILKRAGGSVILMGKVNYHFKDDGQDRHVAIVSDPDHFARFMGIPEGFRLVGVAEAETVIPAVALGIQHNVTQAPAAPVKNEAVPAPVAPIAAATDAITQPEPPPIKEDEAFPPLDGDAAAVLEGKTLEELRAIFTTEVGRKPSDKAKPDTLIAQIESMRAERAAAGK